MACLFVVIIALWFKQVGYLFFQADPRPWRTVTVIATAPLPSTCCHAPSSLDPGALFH